MLLQRGYPLRVLTGNPPVPARALPDAPGERLSYPGRAQHPPHPHEHENEYDERRHLVDHVVDVARHGQRWILHHVDAVRLSPGPSFPASPSRALVSRRSVKSTRSASSATSRRSSSTAASTSSCPAAPPAWLWALSFAM